MQLNRRELLAGLGGLVVTERLAQTPSSTPQGKTFPCKSDFAIPAELTYINGAFSHPMPSASVEAVRQYSERRARPGGINAPGNSAMIKAVKEEFAGLINARASEISFIPNTSTGENLVVNGLGIVGSGGNVVTDALHFEGAIIHLQALQRERGLDLRIAMPRDGRIEMRDLNRTTRHWDTRLATETQSHRETVKKPQVSQWFHLLSVSL
jgi:selenocysteine lyase/cysteine desulfurase